MLAYILYLMFCLFMHGIWDNKTEQRIVFAVVVAGAFFSVADLLYSLKSIKIQRIKDKRDLLAIAIKAITEGSESIHRLRNECITSNRSLNDENMPSGISADEISKVLTGLEHEIARLEEEKNAQSIVGNVLMLLGTLLFFILATMEFAGDILASVNYYSTVLAFVFVVLNFYIKQVYASNAQDDLDDMKVRYLKGEKIFDS